MPINEDYGYQSPEADDESSQQWMPTIEDFMRRMIHHSHDGQDSPVLDSVIISRSFQNLVSGRLVYSGLTYTAGDIAITITGNSIATDMFAYGDDTLFSTEVVSVSGDSVVLSQGVTANAVGDGELIFSYWKNIALALLPIVQ